MQIFNQNLIFLSWDQNKQEIGQMKEINIGKNTKKKSCWKRIQETERPKYC